MSLPTDEANAVPDQTMNVGTHVITVMLPPPSGEEFNEADTSCSDDDPDSGEFSDDDTSSYSEDDGGTSSDFHSYSQEGEDDDDTSYDEVDEEGSDLPSTQAVGTPPDKNDLAMSGIVRWHKRSGKRSSGFTVIGVPPFRVPNYPSVDDLALDPVPEQLRCPICKETLQRAVVLSHCGHSFCRYCIFQHLRTSRHCPVCRQAMGHRAPPPNLVARDLVEGILVHCDNGVSFSLTTEKYEADKGRDLCPVVFPLERREAHLAVCEHAVQYCEFHNDGCQEILLRKDVAHHQENCEFRSEWCNCEQRVRITDSAAHEEVCTGKIIACQNAKYGCQASFPRRDVAFHLEECRYEAARPLLEASEQKQAALKARVRELKSAVKDMKKSLARFRSTEDTGEANLGEKEKGEDGRVVSGEPRRIKKRRKD